MVYSQSFLKSMRPLKGGRDVVCASCLLISAGISGALAQSGFGDTNSRALEELERKQAEAYTLVETLKDVSNRMIDVLEGEAVLRHDNADGTTKLHYYSPWTKLQKALQDGNGDGNSYTVGTGVLHSDDYITRNTPRHRVCVDDLNANAKMPDVGSNFYALTYFDRDSYGGGFTPQELLSLAVAYSSNPGTVVGVPIGVGVVTVNGSDLEFTDVKGDSSTILACLAETGTWGSDLDGPRLAIYMTNVKPRQLQFVFSKFKERKFGKDFTFPRPTAVWNNGEECGKGRIAPNNDSNRIVGRPLYSRTALQQVAKDAVGDPLEDSSGEEVGSDLATQDAWAKLVAIEDAAISSSDWVYDSTSCRARFTYRTTQEESCVAKVGGEQKEIKRRVALQMREVMPIGTDNEYFYQGFTVDKTDPTNWVASGGTIESRPIADTSRVFTPENRRYYYEARDAIYYEVDPYFAIQRQVSLCDSSKELKLDLTVATVEETEEEETPTSAGDSDPLDETFFAVSGECVHHPIPTQNRVIPERIRIANGRNLGFYETVMQADGNPYQGSDSSYDHYIKSGGKMGTLMMMHEPSDPAVLTSIDASATPPLPAPWDVLARRQARGDSQNIHKEETNKFASYAWVGTVASLSPPVTSGAVVPAYYRVRRGLRYTDWDDFKATFPKPTGMSDDEFNLRLGLMKQAFGFWADEEKKAYPTSDDRFYDDDERLPKTQPNDNGYTSTYLGYWDSIKSEYVPGVDIQGVCASDFEDVVFIYKIQGRHYYKNNGYEVDGVTPKPRTLKNDYSSTQGQAGQTQNTENMALLQPPWYPVGHPYYNAHMALLDKSGYKKHRSNETLKAALKKEFEDNKDADVEGTTNKRAKFDASTGRWSIHEGSYNDPTERYFPRLKQTLKELGFAYKTAAAAFGKVRSTVSDTAADAYTTIEPQYTGTDYEDKGIGHNPVFYNIGSLIDIYN